MARRQWGNRARSGPSHPTARSRYLGMHLGSGRGFQSGVAPAANAPRGFRCHRYLHFNAAARCGIGLYPTVSHPPLRCARQTSPEDIDDLLD